MCFTVSHNLDLIAPSIMAIGSPLPAGVTARGSGRPAAAETHQPLGERHDAPPFDVIAALTHHKSGTFQLTCIWTSLAEAVGARRAEGSCEPFDNAGAVHLQRCLWVQRLTFAKRPVFFRTYHGLARMCGSEKSSPCLYSDTMFPQPNTCRTCTSGYNLTCDKSTLALAASPARQCALDLPRPTSMHVGFVNAVRNPIDIVLSAFRYHATDVFEVEAWLAVKRPAKAWANMLRWSGASKQTIKDLQLAGDDGELSYQQALTRLPPEKGVVLEFWHSVTELYSMSRQYALLKEQPGALQLRFEALRADYNATLLAALKHLRLKKDSQSLLKATLDAGCDPGTWSEEKRAQDTHITAGKGKAKAAEVAESALMAYEPAKKILCELCREMEYDDPRCRAS